MKIIYHAADIMEAHIVAGLLRSHGIEPHVGGHYLQGAVGDLAVQGFAEVYVQDDDIDAAEQVIRSYDSQAEALRRQVAAASATRSGASFWPAHDC